MTAGVWDLAPQWLAQLVAGGRIVAPVSVRGIQLAVAFEHAVTHWAGRSARRCGFIRMTGLSAALETVVPLGPQPGLHALVADGPVPEAGPPHEALSGAEADIAAPSGLRVSGIAERADLDLWLALTEPGLSRLNMMGRHEGRANQAQRRIAGRMPLGGFAQHDSAGRLAVAALAVPSGLARSDRPSGLLPMVTGLAARLSPLTWPSGPPPGTSWAGRAPAAWNLPPTGPEHGRRLRRAG